MTRTLYIRHVPDEVAERLEKLASRAELEELIDELSPSSV